jgi:hypothetical protein
MKVNKKPKEDIYRTLLDDKQQNQYSFETGENVRHNGHSYGRDNEQQDRCEYVDSAIRCTS